MMIEQNTNYAYKLKYMDNPTFDKVRDLSTKFYRELPQALQDELYEALNRGIDILDSEPQMTTYLYAFGPMHHAKLNYAFKQLPKEFLVQPEINIIDYGCGQALGTMCYADFLRENGYEQKVKTITLIEPSEICMKRAALHASAFFPNAEIKTVNKKFDDLTQDDIVCNEETPTLHILSNVLDMLNFNLERFAELVKGCLKGYNQFVCAGPYFNFYEKDDRMKSLCSLLGGNANYSKVFDKYEFDEDKAWTAHFLCFTVGELSEDNSTEVTDEDLANAIEDKFVLYSHDGKKLLGINWKYYDDLYEKHVEFIRNELPQYLHCVKYEDVIGHENYPIKDGTVIICDKAFAAGFDPYEGIYGNSMLRGILIPYSVKIIGESAFEGSELEQIYIPFSVRHIGRFAFSNNTELQHVFIESSLSECYIDSFAFAECNLLKQIIIPHSIRSIQNGTFKNCTSLLQFEIPNSVVSIGEEAFAGCKSLQEIKIPNTVIRIERYAFSNCNSLEKIIIPKGSRERFKKILGKNLWDILVEQ